MKVIIMGRMVKRTIGCGMIDEELLGWLSDGCVGYSNVAGQ